MSWLVPGLIAEGSVNLISSASGTGKTWVAYFLAGCVAHGSEVFGEHARRRKALYLDGENPLYVVKNRLAKLGIAETPDLKIWGGWAADPAPGPDYPLIVDFAKQDRPLLIWDSLVQFHTGDEQSSTQTRAFMKLFRQLADHGATVIVLHHTGKSDSAQDYRGSSDIAAAVDMAYKVKSPKQDTELDTLELTTFKSRFAKPPRMGLQFIEGRGFERYDLPAKGDDGPDVLKIVQEIVAREPGLNQSEIVAAASERGAAKHKVEAALKGERFIARPGNGREKLYYLAEPEQPLPAENIDLAETIQWDLEEKVA
jgi:predicted ATP-dependent serine protease